MTDIPKFEIREKKIGFEVIDLERGMWVASFRMFEDAKVFAQWLASPSPEEACDDTRTEERQRYAKLVNAAQGVIYCWNHARITNEPMVDALVELREAIAMTRPHRGDEA